MCRSRDKVGRNDNEVNQKNSESEEGEGKNEEQMKRRDILIKV